jgi:peptide/nickel transport system substrate-binding protein
MAMTLDQMQRLAQKGRMCRRDFIQLAIAAGVTAGAAQTMFTKAVRAEPKKGGKFIAGIGHGQSSDSLDPATWANAFSADVGFVTGNCLTSIDSKNNAVPDVAESIEPSPDAKTWMFKLRKGVEFHNGKTLTAADVVATYNYHRDEKSKSAVKSVLEDIAEIKADGDETVVFTLKSGSADFPYITSDYHLPIYQAKDGGGIAWEEGVGTGPFVNSSYEPGVRFNAKRNPNYHKDGPNFDEIEMLSIVDVAARQNALITGDIHYMDRCDLKTLNLLKRNPDLEVTDITGFSHYVAPMDVRVAPFDNVDVRLALKWAINRQEVVEKVLLGHGIAGNDNPLAPSIKFATNPEPVYGFDPDKSRFHLKKAGLSELTVDLSAADAAFAGGVDAAVLMKESAAQCGININVIKEANDGYWDTVWMKKPWCFSYWSGRPTADWMFTTAYAAEAAWNDTFWKHPKFNELLVQARAETNDEVRAALYAEMQQILHDDGGIVVLMFNNFTSANNKKVAHGDLNSNYDHDGGYIFERWWFA